MPSKASSLIPITIAALCSIVAAALLIAPLFWCVFWVLSIFGPVEFP